MSRLTWVAKGLLGFVLAVIVFDIIMMCYTYSVVSGAMDDTLDTISAMVAEENCLDTVDGTGNNQDSKYYSALKVMVQNAPIWLVYNDKGMSTDQDENGRWIPVAPTNTQIDMYNDDPDSAIANIDTTCLTLNDEAVTEEGAGTCFLYSTCPQRGETITVSLTGYWTVRVLPHFGNGAGWDGAIRVPITRKVTVVGTKFYKGK